MTQPVSLTPTITAMPEKSAQTVTFNSHKYAYAYFSVSDYRKISLIPNFEIPINAETIVKENNCVDAINAGFYSKDNKPIGLWENGTVSMGGVQTNALLNGFYSIDSYRATIMYDPPSQARLAFQTGPILLNDSASVRLAIKNDEPARRMIAAISDNGISVFMIIYDPLSPLRGPYLNDLPTIIRLIEKQIDITLVDAINLDGGTASAFYSKGEGIWEINPVGSLICSKQ